MSLKFKETVFPQTKVKRNFTDDFNQLRKQLSSNEDAATFFMLADATCPTRPTVNIERIHVDVFKKNKIVEPKNSSSVFETLMILSDKELLKEIKLSRSDTESGDTVPWKKVRART